MAAEKVLAEVQEIVRTVATLAHPGMAPKELLAAVREQHPGASKKEVSRAAFYAMILVAEVDAGVAARVQDLALATRSSAGDESEAAHVPLLKRKKR